MVTRATVLIMLLIFVAPLTVSDAAEHRIQATITDATIEHGRTITIHLQAPRSVFLNKIDLSALEKDFVVHRIGNIEYDSRAPAYSRQLQVYPRRAGRLTVPSLGQGNVASKAFSIDVAPAIDRRDNARIVVRNEISQQQLWVKQGFHVFIDIETDSEIVDIDTPPYMETGFESFVLPTESHRSVTGTGRTTHRLGWAIYPLATGPQILRLPAISFKRDGIVTHRFFPPLYSVQVKPLPTYIPVTLPVGQITITADQSAWIPATTGKLDYLTFQIDAEGLPSQFADFIGNQLGSTDAVSTYPAETKTNTRFSAGAAITRLHYRVPYVATGIGVGQLPTIRVQVFDPLTGTLVTRRYPLGSLFSVPRWIQLLLATIVILILSYLAIVTLSALRAYWHKLLIYRSATRKVRAATRPEDIRHALTEIANAETWPTNLTLDHWIGLWSKNIHSSDTLVMRLNELQAMLYGRAEASLVAIQQELVRACYRRLPLLKILSNPEK
ncbi:MAG: hypothetical protein LJE56_10665 [Acidiferrobacterales bacterium]|nr:hypothetical protein [Acidiferrobacterales bacterium]